MTLDLRLEDWIGVDEDKGWKLSRHWVLYWATQQNGQSNEIMQWGLMGDEAMKGAGIRWWRGCALICFFLLLRVAKSHWSIWTRSSWNYQGQAYHIKSLLPIGMGWGYQMGACSNRLRPHKSTAVEQRWENRHSTWLIGRKQHGRGNEFGFLGEKTQRNWFPNHWSFLV